MKIFGRFLVADHELGRKSCVSFQVSSFKMLSKNIKHAVYKKLMVLRHKIMGVLNPLQSVLSTFKKKILSENDQILII